MAYPAKKDGKYTYSDYLKTPDDKRFQLIEGELLMVPAPNIKHQEAAGKIYFFLKLHLEKNKVGRVFIAPTDIVLDQHNVLQPDVLFVLNVNSRIITEKNIQGAPDLVVEILSESTANLDLVEKKQIYGQFGVKEYWVVSPKPQAVEMFLLKNKRLEPHKSFYEEDVLTSPLLKGLSIKLTDIFSG